MADCPTCGTPLPPDAPAGLCPVCLAKQARASPRPDEAAIVERLRATLAAHASDLELGPVIGRGGMGFVFRGRQRRLEREVAVKVLDPELSKNPAFSERFAREARALARLSHPHIVTVFDYGQAGDLYYLVLEYVDGVNLRQALQAGTIAPPQALAIVPQICDALEFAHGLGVVHRDVKPENILLDRQGRVKIADFGLAKLCGVEVPLGSLTSTGQVLGTLRYMAPEQMERPLEVDHRADIYSLGVVFYEMLTGEIPMGRFAPPSKKVHVDVALDEVVLRTLEREPERRYQHAVEVKTDVEAIGAGKGVQKSLEQRPPAPGAPRLSWLAIASPAVAIGVPLLATMGLVLLILAGRASSARIPAVFPSGIPVDAFGQRVAVVETRGGGASLFVGFSFLCFLGMVVGCALGWAALDRIRREWPRFFGIGAAITGLWLLPLYVVNALLVVALLLATRTLNHPSPGIVIPWVLLLLAADVFWIVHRRRRFLGRLEPGPGPART